MLTRGCKVSVIPEDSDDDNLSDEEEYDLRPTEAIYFNDDGDDVEYLEDIGSDVDYLEDESEDVAISTEAKRVKSTSSRRARKISHKLNWVEKSIVYDSSSTQFLGSQVLPADIMALETPMQFFKYLFPTELLNLIVEQTSLFAQQNNPIKAETISTDDVRKFIGTVIYMSVNHLPSTRHYWKEGTYVDKVASTLTCNKFEDIKRFLHFFDKTKEVKPGDPNYDKLQKIRPLINMLRDRLKQIPKEEYLSIDEQMIPTKSKTSGMRQYNAKKPHKWGYLNYVMSGASGFSYDFDIFTGTHSKDVPDGCPDLGASGNIVTRLLESVTPHLNYKIFVDNWYTSLNLVAHLHSIGILPLGTIQLNRAKNIDLPNSKEILKQGRGYCVEKCTEINGVEVSVTSWVDNKVVNFCSTYVGKEPMTSVSRFKKELKRRVDIPAPKAVEIYNKYMGGVDLLDSMLGFYRIKIRSKKWYHRIFFHLLDMVCVNAWLLWRRRLKQKEDNTYMPLLDFKLYIADVLMKQSTTVFTPTTRGRGRPSHSQDETINPKRRRRFELPSTEVALDDIGHWPIWTEERQRCKFCNLKAYVKCSKCVIHLCFNKDRNCYKKFHEGK